MYVNRSLFTFLYVKAFTLHYNQQITIVLRYILAMKTQYVDNFVNKKNIQIFLFS